MCNYLLILGFHENLVSQCTRFDSPVCVYVLDFQIFKPLLLIDGLIYRLKIWYIQL